MFCIDKKPIERKENDTASPGLNSECEITFYPENIGSDERLFGIPSSRKTKFMCGNAQSYYGIILEDCLAEMKAGERCEFDVTFLRSDPGKLPTVRFTLELHAFTSGVSLHEVTVQERINLSERWKNFGNSFFESGDICMAGNWYSKALKALLSCKHEDDLDQFEDKYKTVICACHINLAAVQLKRKLHDHVVQNCTCALKFNACLIKALFRRAQAYKAMNSSGNAVKDLRLALKIEPSSSVVRALLKSINEDSNNTD